MSKLQEIFNKVSNHLITQNSQARDEKNNCRYRADDGKMCAAGCLIPDEDYKPYWEVTSVHNSNSNSISMYFKSKYTTEEVELISRLQTIHDWEPVTNWKYMLIHTGKEYKLDIPEYLLS